jgi:hypothetical protein
LGPYRLHAQLRTLRRELGLPAWPADRCLWCHRFEDTRQPPRRAGRIIRGFHRRCREESRRSAGERGALTLVEIGRLWRLDESQVRRLAELAYRKLVIVLILEGRVCRVCNSRGWVGSRAKLRSCRTCHGRGYFSDGKPDGMSETLSLRRRWRACPSGSSQTRQRGDRAAPASLLAGT